MWCMNAAMQQIVLDEVQQKELSHAYPHTADIIRNRPEEEQDAGLNIKTIQHHE